MEKTIADILDMAIQREVEAYDFYMDIHHKVQDESVRDTVEFIAKEEIKHKEFFGRLPCGQLWFKFFEDG